MANEQQNDEIIALESIYTKEEFSYDKVDGQYFCTLQIFIKLPEDYYLTYRDERKAEELMKKVPIAHLPPLTLLMTLPRDYPNKHPPTYTLSCSWLSRSRLCKLSKRLGKLWEENKGQEIIFTWVAFLQDDVLPFFQIENSLDASKAYTLFNQKCEGEINYQRVKEATEKAEIPRKSSTQRRNGTTRKPYKRPLNGKTVNEFSVLNQNLVQFLLDYNEERMCIEFRKNFYTCKICFADKIGDSCTQFQPCRHVFCKECIRAYIEVKIKDGAVQSIGCPEDKCTSEASPGQVKDLVGPELFNKYDSILLSITLETMVDIIYCPRRHCQYPVSKELNEKMAHCPACSYVFCIDCKMVYHGIEPCKVSGVEKIKLVSDYQEASQAKKAELESRYGKKQLQTLVDNTMSETWIHTNSQNCPHCNTAIEKSDGCNKMVCGRCSTYFCWICKAQLNKQTPYIHYQNPQSKCFGMLHHGMDISDDEDDLEFDLPYLGEDSDLESEEDDDFYGF